MKYGSDLVSICCYIHELWNKSGWKFLEFISGHCLVFQINSSISYLLIDKSNLVNDVPEWK
jgi:hypothetical protein